MQPASDFAQYVVDASVAIKWHLRDEEHADVAQTILTGYREGQISLLAPEQIRYEVANSLRTAIRMRRLSPDDARGGIEDFLSWGLPTAAGDELILAGYDISLRYGCALYDGLNLALAETLRCPFIHADRRLRTTLAGQFPLELWIGDFTFR